ncbi:hypothetical protein K1719_006907 [Acacia pycnantha]|nr:hypothetical protein K1719_006907 [Acacia pycnantha]
MKISRIYYSFHRSCQLLKFQRKTRVYSSVTLGGNNAHRRSTSFGCFPSSSFLRDIICKLKNRWKLALGWRTSATQHYSYDLRSYCLNFDDNPSNFHIPPPLPLPI